jgi:hypothetical protein
MTSSKGEDEGMTTARETKLMVLLLQAYRAGASGGMFGRERYNWLRAVRRIAKALTPPEEGNG